MRDGVKDGVADSDGVADGVRDGVSDGVREGVKLGVRLGVSDGVNDTDDTDSLKAMDIIAQSSLSSNAQDNAVLSVFSRMLY